MLLTSLTLAGCGCVGASLFTGSAMGSACSTTGSATASTPGVLSVGCKT